MTNDTNMMYLDYDATPDEDAIDFDDYYKSKTTHTQRDNAMRVILELAEDLEMEELKESQPAWMNEPTLMQDHISANQEPHTDKFNQFAENTIPDDNINENDPLPIPYKPGCWHRTYYELESILVKHPRIYAIWLLLKSIIPRGLVVFDMYTDALIAYELYLASERIWFMVSCLFIAFPFVLVWSASLRFIQKYLRDADESSYVGWLLVIYMFPPVGSILIVFYEVYWVFKDIVFGLKAFFFGTGLVKAADRESGAMASYRKAIEVFAESMSCS